MRSRLLAVTVVALLLVGAVVAVQLGVLDGRDRATVTVVDENGTTLATVDVRVADSYDERYTGLSDTESLAAGEGMLFVHPEAGRHTYVMRRMEYGLDIVFVAADGTITRIHHAEPPTRTAGDDLRRYSGTGKYVLEVPYGYTNRTDIDVGDVVRVPPAHRNTDG